MSEAKQWVIVSRHGEFIFALSFCCFTFAFQFECLTSVSSLICTFDLFVKLFVRAIGRGGTVIFVCLVVIRLSLTCFFVRG